MTKYTFVCPNCANVYVKKISMLEYPRIIKLGVRCEECETLMQRVIKPVPVKFVGAGFYVNDK